MKKILFINTCVRKNSRTSKLARYILEKLDGEVTEVRPDLTGFDPLDEASLARRDKLLEAKDFSASEFAAAREFAKADIILIAAPYWDLTFPSLLKIYLENVTVCGVTFYYTENGVPKGLCRAKKLYYVTTSGGEIVHNFGFEYVDALAKEFYGIGETRFISAEGLDIIGADEGGILREAMKRFDAQNELEQN